MSIPGLPPIQFGAPQSVPLLAVPGVLLLLWLRLAWRRRADVTALRHRRMLPVRERIPFLGELLFWLCLLQRWRSRCSPSPGRRPARRSSVPPASIS